MKICFCVDSMGSGGAERVIANLANFFSHIYKYKVSIIIVSDTKKDSFYSLDDEISLNAICENEQKKIKPFNRVKRLKRAILGEKPDVVVSFLPHISIYTHFALKKTFIPHIVSERNDPKRFPKNKIVQLLRNYVFSKSNAVVCQTLLAKDYFSKRIQKKITIIHNPVSDSIKYNSYKQYTNTIIAVGRLEPQKNYYCLFDAFKLFQEKYSNFSLYIFGDGSLKTELSEYLRIKKIANVYFKGKSSSWLEDNAQSFAYVLSSDFEGMPNALLEALCAGIPCVSTDCRVGGPKELISNRKNGLLVKCNDSIAIYNALDELKCNLEFRHLLSLNNKKTKDKYCLEVICKEWDILFRKIIKHETK